MKVSVRLLSGELSFEAEVSASNTLADVLQRGSWPSQTTVVDARGNVLEHQQKLEPLSVHGHIELNIVFLPQGSEYLRSLNSENVITQIEAIRAIGNMGSLSSCYASELCPFLGNEERRVRLACLAALAKMGESAGTKVAAEVAPLCKSRDRELKKAAISTLGALGEAACEQIHEALALFQDWDRSVRQLAATSVGSMGPSVVPQVLPYLATPNAGVRAAAAQALGKVGLTGAPMVAAELSNGDVNVQLAAAEALGYLGEGATEFILPLVTSSEAHIRAGAATALGAVAASGVRNIQLQELVALVKDPSEAVRDAAAGSLIQVGADGAKAMVPVLKHADADVSARVVAAKVIGRSGGCEDAEVLSATIQDSEVPREVCLAAVRALGQLGSKGKAAIPRLEDLMIQQQDLADTEMLLAVVKSLGHMGPAACSTAPKIFATAQGCKSRAILKAARASLKQFGPQAVDFEQKVFDELRCSKLREPLPSCKLGKHLKEDALGRFGRRRTFTDTLICDE